MKLAMKKYSLYVSASLLLFTACSDRTTTVTTQVSVVGFNKVMNASRDNMFTCIIGDVTFSRDAQRSYMSINSTDDSKVEVVTTSSASYARISREPRESSSKTRKELLSRFKNLWITTGRPDDVFVALIPKDPQGCLYLMGADITGNLKETGISLLKTTNSRCSAATVLTARGTIISIHVKDKRGAVCSVISLDNKLDASHFPQANESSPILVSKAEYDLMVGG
jgi:hypothetical protein